jgi:hypothetical protein
VPRGVGDLLIDLAVEPLYVDPSGIATTGDWRMNHNSAWNSETGDPRSSRGVDFSDLTALKAGMSTRSTRTDGEPDSGYADPAITIRRRRLIGDCNGDGRVMVNEIVLGVNIAVGNAPLSECPAASSDGTQVTIADLIQAVGSGLQGSG